MNRRQKIMVSVTGIFLMLLLLVGLTYAYFLTRITGNTNDKSISVSTANLAIVYGNDDGSVIGSGEKITPGTTFEPKTFTVTNNGNANTDYVVVIENANVTYAETIEVDGVTQTAGAEATFESNDFTYTLTCESGCNSVEEPTTFPIEGGILVGNRLDVGETQTYSFTLTYNETGENQTNDMNKKLEAKINIKDITTINPYRDKPNTLAYNIINNAISLTNEEKELGYAELRTIPLTNPAHAANIYEGYEEIEEEILMDLPTDMGEDYKNIYWEYVDEIEVAENGYFILNNVKADRTYEELYDQLEGKYITSDYYEFRGETKNITALYLYKVIEATEDSFTVKKIRPLSKSFETSLSITQDNYGTSYYYRGNVQNNYVTFNNMCWRIVRIQGDGSVKLVLSDYANACESEGYSPTNEASGLIGNVEYGVVNDDRFGNNGMKLDFSLYSNNIFRTYITNVLEKFKVGGTYDIGTSNNKVTYTYQGITEENLTKLKTETWCIGNPNLFYSNLFYDTDKWGEFKTLDEIKELILTRSLSYNYDVGYRLGMGLYSFNTYAPEINSSLYCTPDSRTYVGNVALLSADEVAHSGLSSIKGNYNSYLLDNAKNEWHTMSISGFFSTSGGTSTEYKISVVDITNDENYLDDGFVVKSGGGSAQVRPAIVLNKNILSTGSGTLEEPYIIQ